MFLQLQQSSFMNIASKDTGISSTEASESTFIIGKVAGGHVLTQKAYNLFFKADHAV